MSDTPRYCDWIAVDWGTSHLRVWAMKGGRSIASKSSDNGMNTLPKQDFEGALLDLVEPWLGEAPVPVIACGMVGSRQGWAEAPYRSVPCEPLAGAGIPVTTADARLSVTLIPGLRQDDPADVMRGEETQVAGYLASVPGFDGVLCLPGTHSKWVQVSAGEVVSFRTFMTGELFDLAAHQSVLRHSVGTGWDDAAFADAVNDALSRPQALAARLFTIRAENLLFDLDPDTGRARLSGYLIGAELAAARPFWLGQPVAIIGAEGVADAYGRALALQGVEAVRADAGDMTRAGLRRALSCQRESAA